MSSLTTYKLAERLESGPVLDLLARKLGPSVLIWLKAPPSDDLAITLAAKGSAGEVEALVRISTSSRVLSAIRRRNKRKGVAVALAENRYLSFDDAVALYTENLQKDPALSLNVFSHRSDAERWELLTQHTPTDLPWRMTNPLTNARRLSPLRPFDEVLAEYLTHLDENPGIRSLEHPLPTSLLNARTPLERWTMLTERVPERGRSSPWDAHVASTVVQLASAGTYRDAMKFGLDREATKTLLAGALASELDELVEELVTSLSSRLDPESGRWSFRLSDRLVEPLLEWAGGDTVRIRLLMSSNLFGTHVALLAASLKGDLPVDPVDLVEPLSNGELGTLVLQNEVRDLPVPLGLVKRVSTATRDSWSGTRRAPWSPEVITYLFSRVNQHVASDMALGVKDLDLLNVLVALRPAAFHRVPLTTEQLFGLLDLGHDPVRVASLVSRDAARSNPTLRRLVLEKGSVALATSLVVTPEEVSVLAARALAARAAFDPVMMNFNSSASDSGATLAERVLEKSDDPEERLRILLAFPDVVPHWLIHTARAGELRALRDARRAAGQDEDELLAAVTANLNHTGPWLEDAVDLFALPWARLPDAWQDLLAPRLTSRLGDDLEAWETALVLLPEWEGTLDELVDSVTSL